MKTFKLINMLILMSIVISSCDWLFPSEPPAGLSLALSFQDVSGKDLVKGIGYIPKSKYDSNTGLVEEKLYRLVVFDGENRIPATRDLSISYSESLSFPDNYGYMCFPAIGSGKSRIETTYRLICPYIFGDYVEHEIVAYSKEKDNFYICYRLTFDGEDIEFEQNEKMSYAIATVVLD